MPPDTVVLEHLRSIRGTLDTFVVDMQDVKGRVDSLEQQDAGLSNHLDRIDTRLTRIEQRLDLVETQTSSRARVVDKQVGAEGRRGRLLLPRGEKVARRVG